ncbi:MAG: prolyl oligopeptidase family serine peptidase [Porticoccaceae bacterium]|nr:prolyl oligopeptidase family serine peptidase [Porticoccaceae bacterium]
MKNSRLSNKPLVAVMLTAVLAVSHAVAKLPESVYTILEGAEFSNVSVSPSGKYISAVMQQDERATLVILNRKTMQVEQSIRYEDEDNIEISGGNWVSANLYKYRVLTEYSEGRRPGDFGDQFIYNMETGKNTRIWNYTGTYLNKALRSGKKITGRLDVLSYLPDDEKNILVAVSPFKRDGGVRPTVYKLELSTGDLTKVMNGPARAAAMLTNETADTIVAFAPTEKFTTNFFYRRASDKFWTAIDIDFPGNFSGLNVSDDGKLLFGLTQLKEGPNAHQELVSIALEGGELSVIHDFGFVSQISVEFAEGGHPGYATWVADKPEIKIFQKDIASSVVTGFMKSFKGFSVYNTGMDDAEENMIIAVTSPGVAGEYYVWEKSAGKARYLFSSNEKINDLGLNSFTAINYEASDGVKLQGWLLMPRVGKPKGLVNYIHGGPHGPYISYSFNAYMQIYAELGYAVFAPNFRGSGGYGQNFEEAGYTLWGTRMLDDMREGAEFVQANYDVGDKVYTAGASYGGYSSAQNVVRHNDYYNCSIIDAGFFNFDELKDTWDGRDGFTTDAFTDNAMGQDAEKLKAMSPIYNIDQIRAPMLITHGKVDRRTPLAGAKQFIKALSKTDLDYEYYAYAKEGHGLWFKPNRLDRFGKVKKFLERCDRMASAVKSN